MTATTSKRTFVGERGTRRVSPYAKTKVPAVLREFLWDLAVSKNWQNGQTQWFVLRTKILGGRKLQQIQHTAQGNGAMETHRVFGVEPVDCTLQVFSVQGGYEMRLCEEGRTCVSQRRII